MNKRYAIFDMDGTIIDSMGYWKQLGVEYLHSKGITENIQERLDKVKALTITESANLFREQFSMEGTTHSIAQEINNLMNTHYENDIPLKKGVKEYIKMLSEKGVVMCVASATATDLMETCLTRLGIANYFQFLLSCEAVGAGKHSPTVYLEAARRFGALPQEIAVYEDALYAAETAKCAGFYTIGVYDASGKEEWESLTDLADECIVAWCE